MSDKLLIHGGKPLHGEVTVSGAKNSVLKHMAAALLSKERLTLTNVPTLSDVSVMAEVLMALGRKVEHDTDKQTLTICEGDATNWEAPYELVTKMRASFNVLGALLGHYGYARVPLPGGCSIGKRAVDQHIKGLLALGADITMDHGCVEARAERLNGANVFLDMPSVGATENILLAAVFADGVTRLSNAAREPEIVDLVNCLNAMGAYIEGGGTSELIIHGVEPGSLKATEFEVMPDRIETATFMVAAVGTNGSVVIDRCRPDHLQAVIEKLEAIGGSVELLSPTRVRVTRREERLKSQSIGTNFYPGFPTDLQAPFMSLLTIAEGSSVITETIYENRFKHVGELSRMGASIEVQGNVAVVEGVERLIGAQVKAHDLRAGAAMVIAGLLAEDTTSIYNLYHLDRGYEKLAEKYGKLGANIQRLPLEDNESKQVASVL